ncbi:MAG: PQQ-binding-like beta-propeller repeat protein [Armatimonadota bacterium]
MRFTILVALIAILSLSALAEDWGYFRGPHADGISRETGINKDWAARPPAMLWKVPLHDQGHAGPSVAAGKVFIIDHQDNKDIVYALNLADGKPVWTFEYPNTGRTDAYGFTETTPVYDNGKLYTLGSLGQVYCLNAETGKPIWSCNLVADYGARLPSWLLAVSPVIDGEKVILCPGSEKGAVLALNKNTGALIWQGGGADKPGYAVPVVATILGVKQYVVFSATSLNGVEAETGKLLWSFPWRTAYDVNAAMPIVGDNFVYITSNYGRGCALVEVTADGPVKRWENKNMHSHFSSPLAVGNLIYGTSDPGRLVCMDPWEDGKIRWQQKGFEKGGLIAIDGVLLVLDGRTGELAMVRITPDAYQEMGRFTPLGGQSWTAPVVANGKLIVRNKAELACFDLK